MWFPKELELLANKSTNKLSVFICQAWHQLLSVDSPDSYRARVMDLPLLLDELREVAELAQEDHRLEGHLALIRAEISEAMREEETFLASRPELRSHLVSLASSSTSCGPRQLSDQLRVLQTLWGDPLQTWCEDAMRRLRAAEELGHKRDLLHRLSTLATHVQKAEAQHAALAVLGDDLCTKPPEEVLRTICAACSAPEQEYECYVAVRGARSDLFGTLHGIAFVEPRLKRISASLAGKDWLLAIGDQNKVTTTLVARSPRLAAELALERLSAVTNLHNLYKNADSLRATTDVLVVPKYTGLGQIVRVTPGAHFGLKPRRDYAELTRDRFLAMGDRMEGRVANALESHTIALAADDAKISLLNLWTALETLAGPVGPTSIGVRVADRISPIIAWRRVDKIVTSLTIELNDYCKRFSVKRSHKLFPSSGTYWIATDDVFTALTGPANNSTIGHIFRLLGSNAPLLTYRMYEAWLELSEPKTLKRRLARSQERVEWQMHRIYRARNLLVHQGKSHRVVWRLLQNAQYYLSTALGRILHDLAAQSGWDIDHSIEYRRLRYAYVLGSLTDNSPLVRSDLLTEKTREPSKRVWP